MSGYIKGRQGIDILFSVRKFDTLRISRHDPIGYTPDREHGAFFYTLGGDSV